MKAKNWTLHLVMMLFALLGTASVFTACESDFFIDPDSAEGQLRLFKKNFDVSVVDAERVGNNLMVEVEITNKTAKTSRLQIQDAKVMDDTGSEYGNIRYRFGEEDYKMYNTQTEIRGGATVTATLAILDFGFDADKKKNVNIQLGMFARDMDMNSTIVFPLASKMTWKDNRVTSHGVQTCDRGLDFEVLSCELDQDGNCILTYSLKNNTGRSINFRVGSSSCFDDRGNTYDSSRIAYAFGEDRFRIYNNSVQLRQDASIEGRIRIEQFSPSAKEVNLYMGCDDMSRVYFFDHGYTRFFDIPVK